MAEKREHILQRGYYTPTLTVTDTAREKAECSTIIFKNTGACVVMIDDQIRLLPNEGLEITGYPGEINMHTYEINFIQPEGGTLIQTLVITRKVYTDTWY